MPSSKKFFQDRFILLLVGINAFLAFLIIVTVLLRLPNTATGAIIVQYRANLGISAFKTGNSSSLYSFMAFAVLVLVGNFVLGLRTYHIRRQLAVVSLSLGSLLLLLGVIVANALLVLR